MQVEDDLCHFGTLALDQVVLHFEDETRQEDEGVGVEHILNLCNLAKVLSSVVSKFLEVVFADLFDRLVSTRQEVLDKEASELLTGA